MEQNQYFMAFNLIEAGYTTWGLAAICLTITFILFWNWRQNRKQNRNSSFVPLLFGLFLFFTVVTFVPTLVEYLRFKREITTNSCTKIEGTIANYKLETKGANIRESFSLNGTEFHYYENDFTNAFHRTASSGGPMHPNARVRICYSSDGGSILTLEIQRQ